MQLVAYGAQDVYLTGNPQITYWKVVYKRCTNFAMESIEQVFNGRGDFGKYLKCLVSRNGDLIYRTYLVATLPEITCCWERKGEGNGANDPNTGDNAVAGETASQAYVTWANGQPGQDATWARWIDYPGENLIEYVEIEIGGQRIDRQYGEWMHIWNQLSLTNEKREAYNKMIGHTTQLTYLTMGEADKNHNCVCCKTLCTDCEGPCNTCAFRCNLPETTLYIPLLFWYCQNPGLALPLIALQYHEVNINVQLRKLDCMLWAVDSLNDGSGTFLNPHDVSCNLTTLPREGPSMRATRQNPNGAYNKHLVTCSIFIDYIFLDRNERRFMAQNTHEYLIEQVQYNDPVSAQTSEVSMELDFNHPCKEIFLTVQQEYFRDCCKQFEACEPLYKALGVQPFNYTDCLDAMPPAYHAFHGPTNPPPHTYYGERIIHEGLFRNPGAAQTFFGGPWDRDVYSDGWKNPPATATTSHAPLGGFGFQSSVSDAGSIVLAESALNLHCWGKNPVYSLVLQLNGQDRFSERSGRWFDEVQPFEYHTHLPDTGINLYSFALHPEEHNPSGTLNFSRIDNSTLRFIVSNFMFNNNNNSVNINLYATNYNILRIMSGMGGLAYSN